MGTEAPGTAGSPACREGRPDASGGSGGAEPPGAGEVGGTAAASPSASAFSRPVEAHGIGKPSPDSWGTVARSLWGVRTSSPRLDEPRGTAGLAAEPVPGCGGGGGGSPGRRQRWVSGAQPGLGVDPGCAPAPGVPGGGSLPRSSGEEVVGEGREPPGGAAPEPLGPGGPSQVRAAECKAPAPRALTQHLPEPCSRGGTKRPLKAAGSRRSPFGPPVMSTRVQVRTALPLSAAVGAALWSTGWAAGWALPGSFLERPWQDRWGSTCMSLPGSRAPDP